MYICSEHYERFSFFVSGYGTKREVCITFQSIIYSLFVYKCIIYLCFIVIHVGVRTVFAPFSGNLVFRYERLFFSETFIILCSLILLKI